MTILTSLRRPKFTKAEDDLILAGEQMSNVIFNLGQHNGVLAPYRDLQVQWDKARMALREERVAIANKRRPKP